MAFGHESQPTRKYAYGVREKLRHTKQRFPGHDLAIDQLVKAQRFRNTLVEIERERRAGTAATLGDLDARLREAECRIETLAGEIGTLATCLKAANTTGRRKAADPAIAGRLRERRAELKSLRAGYREMRRAAYADPANRDALAAIDAAAAERVAAARAEARRSGLSWPTANHVATRVKRSGPPPKFQRIDASGTLAFQIQRKGDRASARVPVLAADGSPRLHPRSGRPMTRPAAYKPFRAAEAASPNTLLWIEPQPGGDPRYVYVHFRLKSAEDGSPVWAVLPTKMHRPLPPDAEIKWVYLSRKRVGSHMKWEVLFDLAKAAWPDRPRAASGVVGVSLGWTMTGRGLRVACWAGDDGRTGEVVVPKRRLAGWSQVEHLRAVRDKLLDDHKDALLGWMHGNELAVRHAASVYSQQPLTRGKKHGDKREDPRVNIRQWRSPRKIAALVAWWRNNRVDGDGELFARLEGQLAEVAGRRHYTGGVRQDRHLWDWQENLRRKCVAWRRAFYRGVAIELGRRYRYVAVPATDWAAAARNRPVEDADKDVDKTNRGIAAVASLRDVLGEWMDPIPVKPAGSRERSGGEPGDRAAAAAKEMLALGLRAGSDAGTARGA